MVRTTILALALMGLVWMAKGREIPSNLKSLYNEVKSKRCSNPLSGEFEDGHAGWVYCGDRLESDGIIYITGPSSSRPLADMDISCDGEDNLAGDCANDGSGESQTAFKHLVQEYGISDLNPNKHTFVVLGNAGGNPHWMPDDGAGVEPLSLVAVVCNDRLIYGVWGDTNGGTLTGEASISLAKMCFPDEHVTGDSGHTDHDVLYVAFRGKDAVPGADGAQWRVDDAEEFESSLANVGNRLVSRISGSV
ncbi:hypothetical protein VTO42DRAFT_3163 [Malbranchea cinnamomea]